MKRITPGIASFVALIVMIGSVQPVFAQAINPQKSAKAGAASDARVIAASIMDDEDVMFLSQKAIELRGVDERVKELAQQLREDRSVMLFGMEQLKSAGAGSSGNAAGQDENHAQATAINAKLSSISGSEFDTVWVASLLGMHQARLDELTQRKETVQNPQLKMAITEAIPMVRKSLTQLRSLQRNLARAIVLKIKEEAATKKREEAALKKKAK